MVVWEEVFARHRCMIAIMCTLITSFFKSQSHCVVGNLQDIIAYLIVSSARTNTTAISAQATCVSLICRYWSTIVWLHRKTPAFAAKSMQRLSLNLTPVARSQHLQSFPTRHLLTGLQRPHDDTFKLTLEPKSY
jgi:hypothetical protein